MTRISRKEQAEAILGHHFADPQLLEMALTHPSAVEGQRLALSYERLEFLGDSILGAIVASELFERYPELNEGELTKLKISLVSGETLSGVAEGLGVAALIIFGESELGTGSRGMHKALENVFEALIGALYLDAGYRSARSFVLASLESRIAQVVERRHMPDSPKSILQEITQRDFRCAPDYKIVGVKGPAHSPSFTAVVSVDGRRMGRGSGSSKKEAESQAAARAIAELGHEDLLAPSSADMTP